MGGTAGTRLTVWAAAGGMLLALLASGAAASAAAASPSPPLPGGRYVGETHKGQARNLVVKVRGAGNEGMLRGFVRYRCARIKASFHSDDGTFVARQRNRKGRVIFKAKGKFKRMSRATGKVRRLKRSRRRPGCTRAHFSTKLVNGGRIATKTIRYGPFHTDPTGGMGGHGSGGHNVGLGNLEQPCTDCAIVGMVPELREADGSRGNFNTQSMLHHVVFFNSGAKDATCSGWSERFFASGNERSVFVLPRGYGYKVEPGDRWNLLTHLMNMSSQAKDLFIEVTFYYVADASSVEGVKPFWWDINNCGNSEYATPAGVHTEARNFTVPPALDGKVVAIGGHLHDYGERIKLTDLSSGETVCGAGAGYGNDPSYMGHIDHVGGCTGRPVARLRAGEKVRLLSRYDAPEPIDNVMGIMVGYVAPSA